MSPHFWIGSSSNSNKSCPRTKRLAFRSKQIFLIHRTDGSLETRDPDAETVNMKHQRRCTMFCFLSLTLALLSADPLWAAHETAQTFTLDGQLALNGSTSPLLDTAAKITIQILDPSKTCLLYEEEQTVNTQTKNGYFNIQVGSFPVQVGSDVSYQKRTGSDPGRSMNQIYQNTSAIAATSAPGETCVSGTYTPVVGDARVFRLIVTPSGGTPDLLQPDTVLDAVPNATVAESVQGYKANQLLILGAGDLTQANLQTVFATGNAAKLGTLLSHDPSLYVLKDAGNGTIQLPTASTPASPTLGQVWYDAGVIKFWNGSEQTLGVSGAGITSLNAGTGLNVGAGPGGTITTGGQTLNVDVGLSAGKIMQVAAGGKVPALDGSNLTNLNGSAIASGTIGGSTALNTSGNLATTGTLAAASLSATSANLRSITLTNASTESITLQPAASITGSPLTFTWPGSVGGASQLLATDGSTGALSWKSLSSADLSNNADLLKVSNMPANCLSGKTLTFSSPSGAWVCSDIVVTGANFGNQAPNAVLAGPTSGPNAAPSFRALAASDLPSSIIYHGMQPGALNIGTNDNSSLTLSSNSSSLVTLTPTGSVGIGTNNPTSLLEISKEWAAPATTNLLHTSTSYNDTSRLSIRRSNGTASSPTAVLAGDAIGNLNFRGHDGSAFSSSGRGVIYAIATENYAPTAQGTGLGFQTTPNGGTSAVDRLYINENGNVGIGTTNPSQILHVLGQTTDTRLKVTNGSATSSSNTSSLDLSAMSSTQERTATLIQSWFSDTTDATRTATLLITPAINGSYAASTMTLVGGNVGIGTTSPSALLHLKSSSGTANSAPLKFSSGTNLSTIEDGAMEFDGSQLYFSSGGVRRTLASTSGGTIGGNISTVNNSSGSITMNPMAGNSVIVNSNTVSTNTTSGALIVNGGAGIAGQLNVGGGINSMSTTAATGSSNVSSPPFYLTANYWDGTASALDRWSITNIMGVGTNPTSTLTFDHTPGTSGAKSYAFLNGNMGVGTSTPASLLSVYNSSSTPAVNLSVFSDFDASVVATRSSTLKLSQRYSAGSSGVSNGNDWTVDVAQGQGLANLVAGAQVDSTGLGYNYTGARGASRIQMTDGSLTLWTGNNTGSNTAGNPVTWSNGNSPALTINSLGSVGIGTANPSAPLHILRTYPTTSGNEEYGTFVETVFAGSDNIYKAGIRASTTSFHSSGTLSDLEGVMSLVSGGNTPATTTNAFAFWGRTDSGTSHTVTNGGGLMVNDSLGAGSMTNQYGVFIANLAKATNNNFAIYAAGSTKSFFGGAVGIGATHPVSPLDIYSTANSVVSLRTLGASAGNQAAINMVTQDDGTGLGSPTNKGWQVSARGNAFDGINDNQLLFSYWNGLGFDSPLTLAPTGKVGIGTTNPGRKLHVSDTAPAGVTGIAVSAADDGNTLFSLQTKGANGVVSNVSSKGWNINALGDSNAATSSQNDLRFDYWAGGSGATVATLKGNGNVGIGTAQPTTSLEVASTQATPVRLMSSNPNTRVRVGTVAPSSISNTVSFDFAANTLSNERLAASFTAGFTDVTDANRTSSLYLQLASAGALYNALVLSPSGMALGGYPAPGASTNLYLNNLTGAGNFKNQILFQSNGANKWSIANDLGANGTQDFVIYDNVASANRFYINSLGNIGIGMANPDERLVVYNGSTTGKYTTTGWTHSSDIRLKHDIAPLKNSLDKVLRLQGVEYKFNSDPSDKVQIGFIAQQVEPVFPEVVQTDQDGFKSMVYANLVAPLVESVKTLYQHLLKIDQSQAAQQREIASLRARVTKTEQENQELKARLDKIERALTSK